MKIQYNFRKTRESKRENYINKIVEIIEEYKAKGINRLTVRQLYYQLVSRGFHESDGSKNEGRSYGRTFDACSMGRQDGRIDWDVIEDRSREMITYSMWASPSAIISASARQYREDYWKKQKWRPEVWIEKQALIGLLEDTCREYQVPLYTPRGFNSISNMFEAGQRFKDHIENDQTPIVIYLGDLDPAGEEMTEVARRQLAQYAGEPGDEYDPDGEPCDIEVRRIAMNPGQADRRTSFKLKKDDSKFPKYFAKYRIDYGWELDAMDPIAMRILVRDEIKKLINQKAWKASKAHEATNRALLDEIAEEHADDDDDDDDE